MSAIKYLWAFRITATLSPQTHPLKIPHFLGIIKYFEGPLGAECDDWCPAPDHHLLGTMPIKGAASGARRRPGCGRCVGMRRRCDNCRNCGTRHPCGAQVSHLLYCGTGAGQGATSSLLGNVNQDSHPRAHFLKYATFGLVIKVTEIKGN